MRDAGGGASNRNGTDQRRCGAARAGAGGRRNLGGLSRIIAGDRRSGPDRDRRPTAGSPSTSRSPRAARKPRAKPWRRCAISWGIGGFTDVTERCRFPVSRFRHRRPGRGRPATAPDVSPSLGQALQLLTRGDHGRRTTGPTTPRARSVSASAFPTRNARSPGLGNLRVPTSTGLVPDLQLRHLRADREARHGPACR